jgi:hypothetical protein
MPALISAGELVLICSSNSSDTSGVVEAVVLFLLPLDAVEGSDEREAT